jgi:hypothetical protein
MPATTLDALCPLDEFLPHPVETVEARHHHLDRCRRVRVGPAVAVVFEDRHTLWFRIQELARFARSASAGVVRRQLDWYRRLMPGDGRLTAAVWVSRRGQAARPARAAGPGGRVALRSDSGHEVVGRYLPGQVTDRLIGLVRWAEFQFPPDARAALGDPAVGWALSVEAEGVECGPVPLPAETVQSLADDLDPSGR